MHDVSSRPSLHQQSDLLVYVFCLFCGGALVFDGAGMPLPLFLPRLWGLSTATRCCCQHFVHQGGRQSLGSCDFLQLRDHSDCNHSDNENDLYELEGLEFQPRRVARPIRVHQSSERDQLPTFCSRTNHLTKTACLQRRDEVEAMRPPKAQKATAIHHGIMVEAGVDTMTTIHTMVGNAKDVTA